MQLKVNFDNISTENHMQQEWVPATKYHGRYHNSKRLVAFTNSFSLGTILWCLSVLKLTNSTSPANERYLPFQNILVARGWPVSSNTVPLFKEEPEPTESGMCASLQINHGRAELSSLSQLLSDQLEPYYSFRHRFPGQLRSEIVCVNPRLTNPAHSNGKSSCPQGLMSSGRFSG
ncbi:hypothetical protein ANTPLA_LOCUS5059 [Anthophora plagiata]